uniref:PHD-type domain-containing protein n=1 Tax=Anopheles minimus TaxID=112268 RepID=A0A182W5K6_9DIPT
MANRKLYFLENENGNCRLCSEPDDPKEMVRCDECDRWFHASCAGVLRLPKYGEIFTCVKCNDDKAEYSRVTKQDSTIQALVEALKASGLNASTSMKRMSLSKLPYFDGKPKDWPKFKRTYEETSKEGEFSNLENLNRLQHALKGDAERCVRRLFLDPDNVSTIIWKLEEQFGRPKQVYDDLLREVLKVKVDNQMKIPELSDALEDMITNLKAMKWEAYLQDHRLVDDLVGRLSIGKQLKWIDYKKNIENAYQVANVQHFSEWLLPIAENIRKLPKNAERPRQSVNFNQPQRMANRLQLNGEKDPLTLTWTQNLSVREDNSKRVNCMIRGMNEKKEHMLKGIRTVKDLQLPNQTLSGTKLAVRYPYLKDIKIAD